MNSEKAVSKEQHTSYYADLHSCFHFTDYTCSAALSVCTDIIIDISLRTPSSTPPNISLSRGLIS